jgi:glycosyltransferase involved in cell wall biosynthesis
MEKYPISCCIPTLNEEENIERCIRSVDWVDEVIVLDCGSKDKTVEIAQKLGAKVFKREWDNTANQFSYLFNLAKNQWVLHLDADEECSYTLQWEIKKRFENESINNAEAYRINQKQFFIGKWIRTCGMYPHYGIRLFKKDKVTLTCKGFHHRITVNGRVDIFPEKAVIHHYFARSIEHFWFKTAREAKEMAKWRYQVKEKFSLLKTMFKGKFNFIKNYIIRGGFMDGAEGFFLSLMSSMYIVLQYMLLQEFQKNKQS